MCVLHDKNACCLSKNTLWLITALHTSNRGGQGAGGSVSFTFYMSSLVMLCAWRVGPCLIILI